MMTQQLLAMSEEECKFLVTDIVDCCNNHFHLYISKTKKIMFDFRVKRTVFNCYFSCLFCTCYNYYLLLYIIVSVTFYVHYFVCCVCNVLLTFFDCCTEQFPLTYLISVGVNP